MNILNTKIIYNFIVNPITHRKVSIYGKTGVKILRHYLSILQVGASKLEHLETQETSITPPVIHQIGLGTWFDIYQKSSEQISQLQEIMVHAVENALLNGYNMLDVANSYPAERKIGDKIRKMVSTNKINREDITIISKGGHTKHQMDMAIENYGYVDIYLWHLPTISSNSFAEIYENWIHIVEYAESCGKINHIGISNIYNPLFDKLVKVCKENKITIPQLLQVEIHHLNPEYELVEYCHQENIIPIAYSPLAQGLFLDSENAHPILKKFALKYRCSMYQIALAWNIKRGIIVIPKSANPNNQENNLNAIKIANIMEEIDVQEISANISGDMPLTQAATTSKEISMSFT